MNIPTISRITKSIKENDEVKTFYFNFPGSVTPGQFYMIWIPGVDEIPMSVSYIQDDIKGITFRKIGDATNALFQLKKGDTIGIRGPYGNGFTPKGKHLLFVGGGTGVAMLAPAVEQARKKHSNTTMIIGMKTKKELFFKQRLKKIGAKVLVSTDDGSLGFKGFASELARDLLKKEPFDAVYTCGPELMMKSLLNYCKKIPFQASLERYMKCSIGLCGQCCIGDGLRVCVDGPIFNGKTLQTIEDFGTFQRDASGKKIPL